MSEAAARYPYEAPVTAYGNGGFRFADMSHRGSIICLPSGIHGWQPRTFADVTFEAFARAIAEAGELQLLLLGTGVTQIFPPRELKRAIEAAGFALETMATGAAARTYNVLLAEQRRVGAALLAVD